MAFARRAVSAALLLAGSEAILSFPAGAMEGSVKKTPEWDASVDAAIRELHPLQNTSHAFVKQPNQRNFPDTEHMKYVFIAHESAGTDSVRLVARDFSNIMHLHMCEEGRSDHHCDVYDGPEDVYFFPGLTNDLMSEVLANKNPQRLVHLIRDPIAQYVSGHAAGTLMQLHKTNAKKYPREELRLQRTMSYADRVSVESPYFVKTRGKFQSQLVEDSSGNVVHVKYESLTHSPQDYVENAVRVYEHLVGDSATKMQLEMLRAMAQTSSKMLAAPLVSEDMKERAKQFIRDIPPETMADFDTIRSELHY
uniref:Sulfotransferase n=1 Tax=Alexandrium andersonii TaxID=327968 RepID=A0A7S2ND11_9DINO|mmetsp:Transcript_9153/g.20755  ORF Transcript_9153/g.20755 Transcript_9153/m.20755 type:complete len:308 (+) Transcript_9153:93-1016(+)